MIINPMLFAHAATWLFEGHPRKMKRSFIRPLLPVSSSNERLATESAAFLWFSLFTLQRRNASKFDNGGEGGHAGEKGFCGEAVHQARTRKRRSGHNDSATLLPR